MKGGFVRATEILRGPGPFAAGPVHLSYAADQYDDRLFAEFGIAMPAGLARAVPKRRADFLAGRLAAREALRPLGLAYFPVAVGEDRAPRWPAGVVGSISHCAGHAVALCLRAPEAAGVGVDVERIMPRAELGDLPAYIGSAAEFARLAGEASDPPGPAAATLLFSAKESVYKAIYPQIRRVLDYDAVELVAHDRGAGRLTLALRVDLGGRFDDGFRAEVGYLKLDDIVVSVCLV